MVASYLAETTPESTMKDLLQDEWVVYREIPLPNVVVANDPDDPIARIDLNNAENVSGDYIVILSESPETIRYRGNISFSDYIYQITLLVYTNVSRQRLRNIYKQVRAICYDNMHNFSGWQLIRMQSYQEMVNDSLNVWKGVIRLQLENHGVTVDTLV